MIMLDVFEDTACILGSRIFGKKVVINGEHYWLLITVFFQLLY